MLQSENEVLVKTTVWRMLSDALHPYFDRGYLAMKGSTINTFGTRNSDLDLCLAIRWDEKKTYDRYIICDILRRAKSILLEEEFVSNITLIPARVPILRVYLIFPFNHLQVEMSCNCIAGIFNTHLLSYYGRLDERVPAMASYLKNWAKKQGIINPKNGTLNSYSMVLMVIHFLQCAVDPPILPNLIDVFPDIFSGKGHVHELEYGLQLNLPDIPKNDRSLAELIYGFLNYYAQFDYKKVGISIRKGRVFDRSQRPKEEHKFLFMLEEAYDGTTVPKNLTKEKKLQKIVKGFQEARDELLMYLVGGTLKALPSSKDGIPLGKQHFLGSANLDPGQIPDFNSTRDEEERKLTSNSTVINLTNRIHVFGPCLHPTETNPRDLQREDIQTYFGQFGKVIHVSVKKILDDIRTNSIVTFANCDSAEKCIEFALHQKHKILVQNFYVGRAKPTKGMKKIPAGLTNKMFVSGPCLHPEKMNPTAFLERKFTRTLADSETLPP
ncbi:cid1 family poly A polymerase domain-containing protein [Ditylenchus destructor]|uniref:Speckle targeted PIP5K1A-regulated poly(A) polymerase n=1 Tax=Ditylenchus destructor TaxID=166010 RepID=A0AAD4MN21_9BILA|nr:cid1 family poly A polymerase domain-containing protein [Ditylenchus destructor]